jgi:tight adherence protein C
VERLILLTIFCAIAILAQGVFGPSARERIALRRTIGVRPGHQDPLALEDQELALPFGQRVIAPAMASLRAKVLHYTPVGVRRRAEERLLRAGRPMEVGALFTFRVLMLLVLLAVGLLFALALSNWSPMKRTLIVCACAGVGWVFPDVWLGGRISRRRTTIQVALPDVLDLLCISVEAGLGFDAAIQKVAEKFRGPLGEEFQEYIKEVKLGRPRMDALRALARRVDLEEIRTFVAALIQAEQLGVSLAQVLRVQAEQMRYRRKQRAQERAMKMPVKIIFPLVIFVLPTIFIVLFAPMAVQLMGIMSGTR